VAASSPNAESAFFQDAPGSFWGWMMVSKMIAKKTMVMAGHRTPQGVPFENPEP
jgi:hypothetical protein